jgi:hypothetical protein
MTNPTKRPASYPLRLEPELSKWVKELAKANDRSINAEISRIIRRAQETSRITSEKEASK